MGGDVGVGIDGNGWGAAKVVTVALLLAMVGLLPARPAAGGSPAAEMDGPFTPLATYSVSGSSPQVLSVAPDGQSVAYTDLESQEVGLVDLTDPADPVEIDTVPTDLWPTAVVHTYHDDAPTDSSGSVFALTLHDGRLDRIILNGQEADGPPGTLDVVDLETRSLVRRFVLAGAPEDAAVSPNDRYLVIAIENPRSPAVAGGAMPQGPGGSVTIVDMAGPLGEWTLRDVDLSGLATRFADDPEPEHVDVRAGVAVVTLQENNHVVHIRLADGAIVRHFSAGTTTHPADLTADGNVSFTETLAAARREPDAVAWTPGGRMVTANEGTYDVDLADGEHVGGRNFTVFGRRGGVRWEVGAGMERHAHAAGLYPDDRSAERGVEPEGVDVARFGDHTYAFIGAKHGDFVAVYELIGPSERPAFVQLLPTGDQPDDIVAIPSRGLLLAANQGDGTISIFSLAT